MDLSFLPALNACLNGLATALLLLGRWLIHQKRVEAHRRVMLSAFGVSSVFLVGYLAHKFWRDFQHTSFQGEGALQGVYLALLVSHVLLAMAVPVMALRLIFLGSQGRMAAHRNLARWAWPIWLYVSVTGVVIYWMLYHLGPSLSL